MYYGFRSSSGGVTVTVMGVQIDAQPRCSCGELARFADREGRYQCGRCAAIAKAEMWLEASFLACRNAGERSRLYRALSTIYHPDAGGDERLMKALNAVKERFA